MRRSKSFINHFLLLDIFWTFTLPQVVSGTSTEVIKIGALLGNNKFAEPALYLMRKYMDQINSDPDYLPGFTLELVHHQYSSEGNSFSGLQNTCDMMEQNVVAVIGPGSSTDVRAIHPICAGLHIPQIAPFATDPNLIKLDHPYLARMSAPDDIQSRALADLVERYSWRRMAIIVDNTAYGRNGLQEFQRIATLKNWLVLSYETFDRPADDKVLDVMPQLLRIKETGVRVIVLNTVREFAFQLLDQAESLGMMEKGWAWLVTDGTTVSTEPMFQRNATAVELNPICQNEMNADSPECRMSVPIGKQGLIGTMPSIGQGQKQLFKDEGQELGPYEMRQVDSLIVIVTALRNLLESNSTFQTPNNSKGVCRKGKAEPWVFGEIFLQYIMEVQADGLMNYLNFTQEHHVWSTNYDIVNLCADGWKRIGEWKVGNGSHPYLDMTSEPYFPGNTQDVPKDVIVNLKNVTLEITTIVEEPFIQENPDFPHSSSKPFTGYCIDMLDRLQTELGFQYRIRLVRDGYYGAFNPDTRQWNGMMRELIDKEADLSVSALIITAERNNVVDFSKPYMDMGLDILLAKETADADIFYFFRPFSWYLWMCVVGATVLCGVVIALCSFMSPYGWRGRFVQRRQPNNYKHRSTRSKLNYHSAGWFAIASVMQMGPEVSPRSFSGRVVAGAWWAVVTIICASYTANLAAFLTVARLDTGIKTMDDLAEQTDIHYGTIDGTAIQTFFREQTIPPYPRMYSFMSNERTWVNSSKQGEKRVRDSYSISKGKHGKYAYIYDSTVLDYITRQPPCNTRTLKQLFKKSGYGIAFRKNSPYVEAFDTVILELREKGIMEIIEQRWITGTCPDPDSDSGSEPTGGEQLNMEQMAGIFIVFAAGIGLGLICMVLEYIFAASADSFSDRLEGVKPTGSCYHLGRRFRASASDLCNQVCICCGKSRCYNLDEELDENNLEWNNTSHNVYGPEFLTMNASNGLNYQMARRIHSPHVPSPYHNGHFPNGMFTLAEDQIHTSSNGNSNTNNNETNGGVNNFVLKNRNNVETTGGPKAGFQYSNNGFYVGENPTENPEAVL